MLLPSLKNFTCFACYVILLCSVNAQSPAFSFEYKRNDDKSMDILFTKNVPGCYHMRYEFSQLSNSNSSGYNGSVCNDSGTLIHLVPNNPNEGISFRTSVFYARGILNPKIDRDFPYALPLKEEKEVTVLEAYNVNVKYLEAKKNPEWKSFFIYNKKPEEVYAMRKGIVVNIKDSFDSEKTSVDRHFTTKQNEILIEHNDGTFARYIGLSKKSIAVTLGQTVYPHTKLGMISLYDQKNYPLSFSIYYVKKEFTKKNSEEGFKNKENNYGYINPYFSTTKGFQQVEHGKSYVISFNEDLLKKEFTRREHKKYKKNPELFYS